MEVQLFRVDDRLIHGQVVVGWAAQIGTKRIILCDPEIAENEWERELYMSCVPEGLETLVISPVKTAGFLQNGHAINNKTIVLVKSPQIVLQVIENGFIPHSVNLGGIHYTENRTKYLPYLYLSEQDLADLMKITEKGVVIFCQDVPTGKKYFFRDLISKQA